MPNTTTQRKKVSLAEAIWLVGEQLTMARRYLDRPCLRLEIPVLEIDLLAWLNQQQSPVKIYWEDRDSHLRVAGLGASDSVTINSGMDYGVLFSKLQAHAATGEFPIHYYGGFCFDPGTARSQEWSGFGQGRFVLPRFEVVKTPQGTVFACNVLARHLSDDFFQQILDELRNLSGTVAPLPARLPLPLKRTDIPKQDEWEKLVWDILKAIAGGRYQKTVLARRSTLSFGENINPVLLLSRLKGATSNCFFFLFQFKAGEAFVGASPERLYKRDGLTIETEAVAGTRPVSASAPDDKKFQDDLLHSPKDRHEQGLVIDMLGENLAALCDEVSIDPQPSLLHWSGGHHLLTRFRGQLKNGVADTDALAALHPTPAIAGTPTSAAIQEIRRKEPFDRGWYSGPVGHIGKDRTEFAVAIRSGLIRDTIAHLYAGAGIVHGSVPNMEWDETEYKLKNFLKIFEPHAR